MSQPPRRETGWRGIADALEYAASAPQSGADRPGSEDCLFLNVWTPALGDGGKRPILVYIHGGGFNNGSGSDPLYDGVAATNFYCGDDAEAKAVVRGLIEDVGFERGCAFEP